MRSLVSSTKQIVRTMTVNHAVDGAKVDYYTLNDGHKHPTRGYGTYKLGLIPASASGSGGVACVVEEEDVAELVRYACEVGYRCFDCAEFYEQEKKVGEAIKSCGIPREELYIISKVWTTAIYEGPEAVRKHALKSIKELGVGYLDLYLIHWPVPGKHVEAYRELEKLKDEGLLRSIGVSNYTVEDAKELEENNVKYFPSVNQIEVNPFVFRGNTIKYFQTKGTLIQAYRSLCNGKAFDNPLLVSLSKKYDKKIGQILGRYLLQHGIVPLSKSGKKERIKENFDVIDFDIEKDDIEALDNLTTEDTLKKRAELYQQCVVRDTPLAARVANNDDVGVRQAFTID